MNNDIVLKVDNLHTYFRVGGRIVKAVNGVSFELKERHTLGILGESGCGKSVTALSILQLLPTLSEIKSGTITYYKDSEEIVISSLKKNSKKMRAIRGKEIAIIFQDPIGSLNPVYNIGTQIIENLIQHEEISKKEAVRRVVELLTQLNIPLAFERIQDFPHQLSGGMNQRVMIAIAMICNPRVLIADEPTTALDVTVQAQILELIKELKQKFGTSVILITHNIGVIAEMADDIAVMYMGKIVEYGNIRQIFNFPSHPYTIALLESVPVLGIHEKKRLKHIRGTTPDPSNMPEGCEFVPRCDFATSQCKAAPDVTNLSNGHQVRCWNYRERMI